MGLMRPKTGRWHQSVSNCFAFVCLWDNAFGRLAGVSREDASARGDSWTGRVDRRRGDIQLSLKDVDA